MQKRVISTRESFLEETALVSMRSGPVLALRVREGNN